MDLLLELRARTAIHHTEIEQTPLLKHVLQETITIEMYLELLKKFWGFYYPVEQAFKKVPEFAFYFPKRAKLPLIIQDLSVFGLADNELFSLPICQNIPAIDTKEQGIGCFYVIEGATLGGQVINKILARTLRITDKTGSAYFSGYGKQSKDMWKSTCEIINSVVYDKIEKENIIQAATDFFVKLNNWLTA